jgi:OmcA/MtrC family decaheme c-type cytochrome
MMSNKLWYMVTFVALMMLPLAGCSGGGSSTVSEKGTQLTVSGNVADVGKSSLKTLFAAAPDLGTLSIIDAQDGTSLGSGAIDSSGAFKNISFTLPSVKAVLVFKADVSLAGTPFRSIIPIDLSNPPAAGISASNSINIVISQDSTNIATTVSAMLGVTGLLGDTGATLASVSKTYADATAQVVNNGGQALAYNTSGLALTGSLASAALLPVRDASTLTFDDLRDTALSVKILSAFIPGNSPIVNFQVVNKASGKGITGLRTFSLHVAQLKPELNGTNSYWQNYIASGLPLTAIPAASSAPSNPSTDAVTSFNADGTVKGKGYIVIDHGDGTYTATFGANIKANTNVVYDATLTHRIALTVRSVVVPGVVGKTAGAYPGAINPLTGAVIAQFTNTNGAASAYDFVPATGAVLSDATGKQVFARDIVTIDACNQCHYRLEFGSNNTSGHFGSRPDTKICVMCHTYQLTGPVSATNPTGSGNFTNFIHKIHMGEELPAVATPVGIAVNEFKYPQDIRNCTFCHKGADVTNWMANPSKNSCGSCHNALDFDKHYGGQTDDKFCGGCHAGASAIKEISAVHLPVVKPAADNAVSLAFAGYSNAKQALPAGVISINSNTNAAYTAAASLSRLPAGAKSISYVIKTVSRNADKQPVMEFKFQVATADAKGVLGTPVDVVFNDPAAKAELIDGFVGSPSVYFAFAVPQDGIAKPVDYNATASAYLRRLWNGTAASVNQATQAGTLVAGPTAGYYTVTLTGVTIPDSAVMLTGGLGYTYGVGSYSKGSYAGTAPFVPFITTTQPLTQTDLAAFPYLLTKNGVTLPIGEGGLSVPADNKWKVATGYTGRRVITDNAKCNACHGRLGVKPTFHAGQRNDAPTCTFCHNVNRTNSGWAVNIKEDVHAIHGAGKRVDKFSWEASAGAKYWTVGYPGVLKNCEQCHVAGFYDFSNSVYTANSGSIFDNMLYTTNASGTMPATVNSILTGTEAIPGSYYAPYVTAGAVYGATFAYNAATGVTTPAAATTLVSSPITSACFSCHDTKTAKGHMVSEGGSIYAPRSDALAKKELCTVCHGGLSSTNAFNQTAPNIKAVHRWW